jgi:hypothetical protein
MIFFMVLNIDKEITDHDGSFAGELGITVITGTQVDHKRVALN